MARWMPEGAKRLTPLGQPSQMTCWLTSYAMLFSSKGENVSQEEIEKRLNDGGFDVATAKGSGLSDDDFVKASSILKTGGMLPGCLWTLQGVRTKLQLHGVLWLALFINPDISKPNVKYHHIMIICGVDEEREQVAIINPWKCNPMDFPIVVWADWKWIRSGLWGTESVTAGCQFFSNN
jgi:hypothetical protein